MNLQNMNIEKIYQDFTPNENDFPLELMEHLTSVCDVPLTQEIKWLIKSVYSETKYRVLLEQST